MKSFAEIDIENKGNYLKLLSAVSKLSGLFSESAVPFINYRVVENIFCRCFDAQNLSRSDTAFDANLDSTGIGIKTFVFNSSAKSEKIAEFNSLSRMLSEFRGIDLAIKLSEFRNDRIELANRLYDIERSIYHIVARQEGELVLFEKDYDKIDVANIRVLNQSRSSLQFEDGKNSYSFNFSKSTLFRKFYIPEDSCKLPIEIIEDPFSLLLELFGDKNFDQASGKLVRGKNYVILPLYGIRCSQKFVFEKSGLNQWNAAGRERDFGEVYIPIPIEIHRQFPCFFPDRDCSFDLQIPSGEIFSAKVCQQDSKALMTNPNSALSDWLLRKVFQLSEGELLTIEKMDELGFDSVQIIKTGVNSYKIDKAKLNSYEGFINRRLR